MFLIDRLIRFLHLAKSLWIATAAQYMASFSTLGTTAIESAPRTGNLNRESKGDPSLLGGLSEDLPDRCHQPIEGRGKKSGGRPKALFEVDGKKIRKLRGDASQEVFSGLCGISADVLQRAERGRASEQTLIKICAYAPKNRQNLTPEDLKNKLTAKSCGN
jgi:hypothetical protein